MNKTHWLSRLMIINYEINHDNKKIISNLYSIRIKVRLDYFWEKWAFQNSSINRINLFISLSSVTR